MLGETIVIIFAELASFDKSEEECVTRQDRMLYILKNSSKLLTPPAWSGQERYTEILDACYIDHFDQEKRKKYDNDMYDERRRRGEINAAIEMGIATGLERGREEGREEGRVAGLKEVAVKLLSSGVEMSVVAEMTGLDIEDLRRLQ